MIDRIKINAFFDIHDWKNFKNLKRKTIYGDKTLLYQIYTAAILHDRFLDILHFIRFNDSITRKI